MTVPDSIVIDSIKSNVHSISQIYCVPREEGKGRMTITFAAAPISGMEQCLCHYALPNRLFRILLVIDARDQDVFELRATGRVAVVVEKFWCRREGSLFIAEELLSVALLIYGKESLPYDTIVYKVL